MSLLSYALQAAPAGWIGLALILLALVLFVVDLAVTNHGLPSIGGVMALVSGGLVLFDSASPYFWASLITLGAVAILATGVLLVGYLKEASTVEERPAKTGIEGMIGEVGIVREPVGTSLPGWVLVHGELWRAVAVVAPEDAYKKDPEQAISAGRRVQVVDLRDGKVVVLPFEQDAFVKRLR